MGRQSPTDGGITLFNENQQDDPQHDLFAPKHHHRFAFLRLIPWCQTRASRFLAGRWRVPRDHLAKSEFCA